MAWVRTIEPDDADGELLDVYREISGEERPRRIANVLKSMTGKGVDAKTEIFQGKDGATRTVKFTIASPGDYEFLCDVHPNQMKGTLTVK